MRNQYADNRPTIAIVAHDVLDTKGGMERVLAELVRRIHQDWRVVVISGQLSSDLRPHVEWRPVRLPRRPFPLKFITFFLLGGIRLARTRADVVHVTGAIVPNRADLATAHFCHAGFRKATGALAPQGRRLLRRMNTALSRALELAAERWCYRPSRIRFIAAVSPSIAAELATHYPTVPVEITPNGVDVQRFAPSSSERERFRRQETIASDELIALFVGGDWDHKGLAVAIGGVAVARRRGANVRLWVVGRGQRHRYYQIAQQSEVGDWVTFFGIRPDVERFYQAADIFVLPSLYEASPLVVHEASACGLPIVGTRVRGIADLVGDGEAGILVDRSSDAVGTALAHLAFDRNQRNAMGLAGLGRADGRTWEESVSGVAELYQLVMRQKASRRSGVGERVR